jgi:hypothetical protein
MLRANQSRDGRALFIFVALVVLSEVIGFTLIGLIFYAAR